MLVTIPNDFLPAADIEDCKKVNFGLFKDRLYGFCIAHEPMDKSIYSDEYAVLLQLLQEARKNAGLTQEELGKRLGQTQSFISKCERGERRLDVVEIRVFCQALNVSFRDFIANLDDAIIMRCSKASDGRR